MTVNDIAVMRRRSDSWLNATQILKVAGIEKGKRTKVLEREILIGEHEKVQGGYGKYQGTWIQWQRGVEFCRQYGVIDLLRPLLEYDMALDGSAGRGDLLNTPTKEQAMAAHRKKQYSLDNGRKPGPLFKSLSSEASQAVFAMNQVRNHTAGSNHSSFSSHHGGSFTGSQQSIPNGSQENAVQNLSRQSQVSTDSTTSFKSIRSNGPDSISQITPKPMSRTMDDLLDGPPRKKLKASQEDLNMDLSQSQKSSVDSIMTDSFHSQDTTLTLPSTVNLSQTSAPHALAPLPPAQNPEEERQIRELRLLFDVPIDQDTDFDKRLAELPMLELDFPMDRSANAALSWAATMGNIPLAKALVNRGASIFRTNDIGETALMRACSSVNNCVQQSFVRLLELLSPTIEIRDAEQRSILHHITLTSAIPSRSGASRYYLETLLEFVVRQGSPQNSFSNQQPIHQLSIDFKAECALPRIISFARLQSDLLDARDSKGDTALNMAARTGNKAIIEQLLEIGADPRIPNRSQLRPIDFGVHIGMLDVDGDTTLVGDESKENIAADAARDAQSCMCRLLPLYENGHSLTVSSAFTRVIQEHAQKFSAELAFQHQTLDTTRAKIRSTSYHIADLTRQIETQRVVHRKRSQRKIKIANLRRTTEEMKSKRLARENSANHHSGTSQSYHQLQIDVNSLPLVDRAVTDSARAYLSTLPTISELRARVDAHKALHSRTDTELRRLDLKSMDREKAYRQILALSMGCEENEIDGLIPKIGAIIKREGGDGTMEGIKLAMLKKLKADLEFSPSDTPRSLT